MCWMGLITFRKEWRLFWQCKQIWRRVNPSHHVYDECDSLVMLMCKYFSIFFAVACIIFYLLNKNSSIGSTNGTGSCHICHSWEFSHKIFGRVSERSRFFFLRSYSFGIDTKVDKYSSLVNKVRVQENIVSCLLTSKTNIK